MRKKTATNRRPKAPANNLPRMGSGLSVWRTWVTSGFQRAIYSELYEQFSLRLKKSPTTKIKQTMTDQTTATQIVQVGTVFVPVADQDRALEFYLTKLGFEKRMDFPYGDGRRWVEVAPPGSVVRIALVPPSEGQPSKGDQAHCALGSKDIDADHATLRARGVDVDAEVARKGGKRAGLVSMAVIVPDPEPAQFFFRDPDGNRFLVVEGG